MKCSACGCEVDPNTEGRCGICDEQLVDCDGEILVKISNGARPAEQCSVCGIPDGRDLPDSFRGSPLCKPCGDFTHHMLMSVRLRTIDVAVHAITDTGKKIAEAISK